MPDLLRSLKNHDHGHLRIVADLWGLELSSSDERSALPELVEGLLEPTQAAEVVDSLSAEARKALDDVVQEGGRLPWAQFVRRYGEVREMGPGRRDRERPYLKPQSPAEILWYRALIDRAFLDTPAGPQEFAYIPDDLLALIPATGPAVQTPLGRRAGPAERAQPFPANDHILDHACTLLAALRLDFSQAQIQGAASEWEPRQPNPITSRPLRALLYAAGLLDDQNQPLLEETRKFLEAPRGEALARLVDIWLTSDSFNELHLLPGLKVEGDWRNEPLRARSAILDFLSEVPSDTWWSLSALVADIHQAHPDFQRPAGDYDSWYLKEEEGQRYLRGFEHWDEVDGALIRYVITGPMHWLGLVDLAAPESEPSAQASARYSGEVRQATAFRFSRWSKALLGDKTPSGLEEEDEALYVRSDARLQAPRLTPRPVRYQIARFSEWEGQRDDDYYYRLTPSALERARDQGLRIEHLLALLKRHTQTLPPTLIEALERWEEHGSEAYLEQALVLRLRTPELLDKLRKSRASRFLGHPLGPTAVIVKPEAWEKVMAILAEMGYLGEWGIR